MQHFIQKFMKQYPTEMARLETSLQQEDQEAVCQVAHSFRPQLEFVGLIKAAELTAAIEQGARKEMAISISELAAAVKKLGIALNGLPFAGRWLGKSDS